jgi:hypothetical protein
MNLRSHRFVRALFAVLNGALLIGMFAGCTDSSAPNAPVAQTATNDDLPAITAFITHPSDRFLVDVRQITGGHPFKGIDAEDPHAGAHVHFDNGAAAWPQNGSEPSNYPTIYAVADGFVSRVDTRFDMGDGNARYGLDLTFAKDGSGSNCRFCYSIEPMAPEPAEGFYKKFLRVREGDRVHQGDLIAWLYTPPGVRGCHIHFHLMVDGKQGFLAPAIFTPEIVAQFHERCGGFKEYSRGVALPPCMGYRIGAAENPFQSGARDRL